MMTHSHRGTTQLISVRTNQAPPRRWKLYGLVGFLGIGLIGLSLGASWGPDLTAQQYKQIRKEIADLSVSERQRLERNLEVYQAFTPEEQQYFWQMQRKIKERDLQPLVDDYMSWLETLSPHERQKIRLSKDPAARMASVKAILHEKREQDERRLPELIARMMEQGEFGTPMLRQLEELDYAEPFVLSQAQLDLIINQIMFAQLNAEQKAKIENSTGLERMFQVLKESISITNHPSDNWPSEEIFQKLTQDGILPPNNNSEEKHFFGRHVPYDMWKRFAFRRLLMRSLMVLQLQEFERKHPVNDKNLRMYFAKLDSSAQATLLDAQATLLESPANYQTEALKWLYLWTTYRDESFLSQKEFRDTVLREMMPPWIKRGRGGPLRPGDRGPGPEGRGPAESFGNPERGDSRRPNFRNGPPADNSAFERRPGDPEGRRPRGQMPPPPAERRPPFPPEEDRE